MQSLFVASPGVRLPQVPSADQKAVETADLLRQLLDVQREHFHLARAIAINNDSVQRWRKFLDKWGADFPGMHAAAKNTLPIVERVYLRMLEDLTTRLADEDADDLDNEFALTEFLDKYGTRLNQLSVIINQLTPIAEAAPLPPPPAPETPSA